MDTKIKPLYMAVSVESKNQKLFQNTTNQFCSIYKDIETNRHHIN